MPEGHHGTGVWTTRPLLGRLERYPCAHPPRSRGLEREKWQMPLVERGTLDYSSPPCFPKGNLSDTFGKIRKASTLPIKWVSQDVPTRILPLTERSHGVERMEGTAKARLLLFTACGEAVPRSPWVSVQPLPGRFHSRRLAATEGPSSWWLALTGPSFSLGLCRTSWFSINWLPFSLGKTPSVTLTHDSLLDLTSHSVSSPSQNKPYCLLNPVTMF